jgi:hypothetical protein
VPVDPASHESSFRKTLDLHTSKEWIQSRKAYWMQRRGERGQTNRHHDRGVERLLKSYN